MMYAGERADSRWAGDEEWRTPVELTLRLVVDGQTIDLTGPKSRYRNLPCLVASEDCTPNAVEADLDASTLRSLATAASIDGKALGCSIRLAAADHRALRDYAARIGLSREEARKQAAATDERRQDRGKVRIGFAARC